MTPPNTALELLSCPFCGGSVVFGYTNYNGDVAATFVYCECGAVGPCIKGHCEIRAADVWNSRATQPAPDCADVLEALRALHTAVTYAAPPKLFNGVDCYEARVPIEFIQQVDAALAAIKGRAV